MRRNPNNLVTKSVFLESFCPNFPFRTLERFVALTMTLERSDKTKPKRKCSRVSSSSMIGFSPHGSRESTKTKTKSRPPTDNIRLSSNTRLNSFHIFRPFRTRLNRNSSQKNFAIKLLSLRFAKTILLISRLEDSEDRLQPHQGADHLRRKAKTFQL